MSNFNVVLNLTNEQIEILRGVLQEAIYQQRTAENALGGFTYSEKYHNLCKVENAIDNEIYRAYTAHENAAHEEAEKNSYWSSNGKYQHLANELQKLIPFSGEVENAKQNPALEKFRKYVNAYYDLFNNGGGNRRQAVQSYFPGAFRKANECKYRGVYAITEPRMDEVILAAAREQGLINNVEAA